MVVYLFLALLPLLLTLVFPSYKENIRQSRYYYFVFSVVYVFFVGLRSFYLGSSDTVQYASDILKAANYEKLSLYIESRSVLETGYNVLVWILSKVLPYRPVLLCFSAIVFSASACNFCKKNSDCPALSLTLYITIELFLFNLQGLRQSLAMAICLFAFEYVKKRKPLQFFLFIALATTFHRTAIVFAPVFFLYGLSVSRNKILLYVPLSFAFFYASNTLINFANTVFKFGDISRTYNNRVNSGGYLTLFIHLFILFISILAMRQFRDDQYGKRNSLLFYVSLLSVICYIMRYFGAREAERISFYFSYAQLALLPNSLMYFNKRSKLIIEIAIILIAISMFISKLINNNFIPYRFFWN